MEDVAGRQVADELGGAVLPVETRPDGWLLNEGVDLALQETPFAIDFHLEEGCIAGDALQADALGRAEIAEAIGDELVVVELDATRHVGTVAVDDVGAEVDAPVGKLAERPAVLAQEQFLALRQVGGFGSFGSSVEAHHEDVYLRAQLAEDAHDVGGVGVSDGVGVVAEGAEAYFDAPRITILGNLHDGVFLPSGNACAADAQGVELLLGGDDALEAEVVGVIVGHAQEVEAGFLQQVGIRGGCAEGVADVRHLLLGLSAVAEGSLEVAGGDVGTLENVLRVAEEVLAVVGR